MVSTFSRGGDVVLLLPTSASWSWIAPVGCVPRLVSASDVSQPASLGCTHSAVYLGLLQEEGEDPEHRRKLFSLGAAPGPIIITLHHFTLMALYSAVSAAEWIADVGFIRTALAHLALAGQVRTPAAACFALCRVESSCTSSADRDRTRLVENKIATWLSQSVAPIVDETGQGCRSPQLKGLPTPASRATDSMPLQVKLWSGPWRNVRLSSTAHLWTDAKIASTILRHTSTAALSSSAASPLPLKDVIKALLRRPLHGAALLIAVSPSNTASAEQQATRTSSPLGTGVPWWVEHGYTMHSPVRGWVLDGRRTALAVDFATSYARARHGAMAGRAMIPFPPPPAAAAGTSLDDCLYALIMPQHTVDLLNEPQIRDACFAPLQLRDVPQRFHSASLGAGADSTNGEDNDVSFGMCPKFVPGAESRFFSLGIPADARVVPPRRRTGDLLAPIAPSSKSGGTTSSNRHTKPTALRQPRPVYPSEQHVLMSAPAQPRPFER